MGMAAETPVSAEHENNISRFPGAKGPSGSGPRDGEFGERLARIEAQMEHVATREDIQKVRVWFLVGVIAAIGVAVPAAIGVAFAAVRLFVP